VRRKLLRRRVARRGFRIFEGRAEESDYRVYISSCEDESWAGCVQIMDHMTLDLLQGRVEISYSD
jgi:hypothetical protein